MLHQVSYLCILCLLPRLDEYSAVVRAADSKPQSRQLNPHRASFYPPLVFGKHECLYFSAACLRGDASLLLESVARLLPHTSDLECDVWPKICPKLGSGTGLRAQIQKRERSVYEGAEENRARERNERASACLFYRLKERVLFASIPPNSTQPTGRTSQDAASSTTICRPHTLTPHTAADAVSVLVPSLFWSASLHESLPMGGGYGRRGAPLESTRFHRVCVALPLSHLSALPFSFHEPAKLKLNYISYLT